jgi:hypothetical protein
MAEDAVVVGSVVATSTPDATTSGNGWMSSLPTELQGEKSLQSFKDIPSLAKSYVEAQKMIGGSIRLPKPDAPPEERDKVIGDIYTKLGRPETPDKYAPTALPDGMVFLPESVKAFQTGAHKEGYTQKQVDFAFTHYSGLVKVALAEQTRLQTKELEESTAALRAKWGGDFDTNLSTAQRFTEQVLGEPVYQLLKSKGLDNHPLIVEKFGEIGSKFGETTPPGGEAVSTGGIADAKAKLEAIYADPKHPFHKGEAQAVQEVWRLTRESLGTPGAKIIATT